MIPADVGCISHLVCVCENTKRHVREKKRKLNDKVDKDGPTPEQLFFLGASVSFDFPSQICQFRALEYSG